MFLITVGRIQDLFKQRGKYVASIGSVVDDAVDDDPAFALHLENLETPIALAMTT